MKHKAKTWNYCWPDDPQPGLLHLEPPALSGEATFWIQCGGGTSEEQNKIDDRLAALWNMAERLGLSTEEINTKESLFRAAPHLFITLQNVRNELSTYPHCPFCGTVHGEGHKEDCIGYEVDEAIRKARSED